MPRENSALDRVEIVLVRARNPQNIGAAARAMHDFGFAHLRVANEYPVPFEAARSAVDASAVLARATAHTGVADAIRPATLVVGTTAAGRRDLEHPLLALAEASPLIHAHLQASPDAQVALLFGSEKTGLSNEDLSFCHLLVTIPMHAHEGIRHPSMNLGQAVAVCLYELVREDELVRERGQGLRSTDSTSTGNRSELPSSAETERMLGLLSAVLAASEYLRHHPARTSAADLRRLVLRMGADRVSAMVWMGIFRQILWKLRASGGADAESRPLADELTDATVAGSGGKLSSS